MRYPILHYLGGFLWWFFIKFCKTDLEQEQSEENRSRNILFSIFLGIVGTSFYIKLLKN